MEGTRLRDKLCFLYSYSFFFFFFFLFFFLFVAVDANIAVFDEVWQKRAQEAEETALEAYDPYPELVNDQINEKVHMSLASNKTDQLVPGQDVSNINLNDTRRQLRVNRGPCRATNPIDRCWRCQADWAQHRKKLSKCVLGFGRKTIGGRNGRIYVVTDPSDNNLVNPLSGTLRHAVIQEEPLWIIFSRSMVIRLSEELIMNSDKTIDGRGYNVHIANGAGITIQFVKNIIIHGLHIHNIHSGSGGTIRDSPTHFGTRTRSDGDGISIFGSSNIWIDHVSMSRCRDGLIDVIEGSTGITISNCHFTDHDEVMLMGASDSADKDKIMQVTIAFNHFGRELVQRMPRCRYGFFHVVNNDYTHWIMYAVGGSKNPTIISQGNRYIAPHLRFAKEVTKREYTPETVWKDWIWKSDGDLLQNGAFFVESGTNYKSQFSKQDVISAKPGSFVTRLTRFAGALNCKKDAPC